MIVMDWIRKLTDIIMPLEPPEEYEEVKETKKAETKAEEPKPARETPTQPTQPAAQTFQADKQAIGFGGGSMKFTHTGGMVSTAENGVTSMGGVRYEAYNSGNSDPSVRPSLAVVKTPQLTMKIYAPTKYDDQVKQIADDLLKHNAVIVNFEGVDDIEQQRIGDFVIGAVYMIDGRAEMVSSKIVLYVPPGIDYESAAARIPMRRYN
ncbi:MAG: cell division protein SepF [Selenomonadaceae bacterium]|nr:cell division protein SepF [Selenomonadaceae bacterium]